jgi:glycosyltransferase involved in cell wall biosynthesis
MAVDQQIWAEDRSSSGDIPRARSAGIAAATQGLLNRIACSDQTASSLGAVERWMHSLDVALVHDYLNQRGGAERVVLELSDIWPAAPIYTSLYRPGSTFPAFAGRDVRTSFLDVVPVDRGFRNLFPLYPAAFRSLGKIVAPVVLTSSSGWAHFARTDQEAFTAVYCHNPARWLYGGEHLHFDGGRSWRQRLIKPALGRLRRMDHKAALRADLYIANSHDVRRRIRRAYGVEAVVIPPPVDVDRFCPGPRGDRLLVISRLLPYKRVDLVVRAAKRVGVGLDIVGDGPMLPALREMAPPNVSLHGACDDAVITELLEAARAVCVAAEEDFGIVAVEAQAAGKPVIAYGRGGALETVEDGVTGVFFHDHSEESLIAALAASEHLSASPREIAQRAQRFSRRAFRHRLAQVLSTAVNADRSDRSIRRTRPVYPAFANAGSADRSTASPIPPLRRLPFT